MVDQHHPDLIISDMLTVAAIDLARDLNIRLVCNVPGPLKLFDMFGLPSFQGCLTAGGWTLLPLNIKSQLLALVSGKLAATIKYMMKSMVLVNSFYGLDEATTIPPNFLMVGPLTKPDR